MLLKRILIIDDEVGFTAMLRLNLESTGEYDVEVINNPKLAVDKALEFIPDIILLDVIMPDMEGPDVALLLKQHKQLISIPIIFLTATVTKEEVKEQHGKIGGHPFVAKPSTLAVLRFAIESNISAVS